MSVTLISRALTLCLHGYFVEEKVMRHRLRRSPGLKPVAWSSGQNFWIAARPYGCDQIEPDLIRVIFELKER